MTMPGFTAEASHYKASGSYHMAARPEQVAGVVVGDAQIFLCRSRHRNRRRCV